MDTYVFRSFPANGREAIGSKSQRRRRGGQVQGRRETKSGAAALWRREHLRWSLRFSGFMEISHAIWPTLILNFRTTCKDTFLNFYSVVSSSRAVRQKMRQHILKRRSDQHFLAKTTFGWIDCPVALQSITSIFFPIWMDEQLLWPYYGH